MKALYYNNETDKVETLKDLEISFNMFGEEYETLSDYITACQWYNNGALRPLYSHIYRLKNDLLRYEEFYDSSERQAIEADIAALERMYLEV